MKTLGKKPIYFTLLMSLALLSHFSGFKIGAVKSFNWDIALMLTPYGIVKNKILSDTYLSPYFSLGQQAQPLDNPTVLYSLLLVNTIVGLWVINTFLRKKR